jgi:uncharacterized secreted protein with C-terminal beta-propeller domain
MRFTRLLPIALLLFAAACDGNGRRIDPADAHLQRFGSCDEMARVLTTRPPEMTFSEGVSGVPIAESDTMGAAGTRGETNLQVEGVDELDLAKADGNFLYTVETGALFVLQRIPAASASILQKVDLGDETPRGLFLTADRLIVVADNQPDAIPYFAAELDPATPVESPSVSLRYFNRRPDGKLEEIETRGIEGTLLDARLVGGTMHVVTSSWLNVPVDDLPGAEVPGLLPENVGCKNILVEKVLLEGEKPEFYPMANNLVCVVSASASDPAVEPASECALTDHGSVVYASKSNLFLASGGWGEQTPIHQFAIHDGGEAPQYLGTALADGWLLNQFSMDEYDGHLRVATHVVRWEEAEGGCGAAGGAMPDDAICVRPTTSTQENLLQVFRLRFGDPELVGRIDGLAEGEQIYAVRFMGDKAFLVTFLTVDPLFAIDLSDPENPRVRGELKVPGFSTYLHPMADGYLLAIGRDDGVQLSIFDVRNLDEPKLARKLVVPGDWTDSEALHNHKAFRYDAESGLVIFPIDIYDGSYAHVFSGFHLYSASLAEGFKKVGQSAFPDGLDTDYFWMQSTGRSFVRDGAIALVGGGELVTRTVASPNADAARLTLTP